MMAFRSSVENRRCGPTLVEGMRPAADFFRSHDAGTWSRAAACWGVCNSRCVIQQFLQHRGGGGAGRGEDPHAVGDRCLVGGHGPRSFVSWRFVDALDAQGQGLVDGVGCLIRPGAFPVKFNMLK